MRLNMPVMLLASLAVLVGLILLLAYGSSPGTSGIGGTGSLLVYCAAGLRVPAEKVAAEYEKAYGVRIEFDFAGSGALLSKMRAAGSGDLYIPAEATYVEDARQFDLLREVAPIGQQRAVIAVRRGNEKNIARLADLLRSDVRLSLAEPKVAAISRVTQRVLADENHNGTPLWDALWNHKLVTRDTVNAVANDIKSGTADAGIVWDATVTQYPELEAVAVPSLAAEPLEMSIAVLAASRQPARALHFLRYLTARDRGLPHWKDAGFEVVAGDKWAERPELKIFAGGLNRPAVQETIRAFAEREGVSVVDSYNGCGILVGQIKTGATPDLYFACDVSFMSDVRDIFAEAENISATELVIIVNAKNAERLAVRELADLARPGLKVGIGHPQQSTLGALTEKLLRKHGLWEGVQRNVLDTPATADRLVEHVVFESLEAAIVYDANTALQRKRLVVIGIDDADAHAVQPIAVSKKSDHAYLARRLIERIESAESRQRFEELGFKWLLEHSAP
jgi:molybdate transport system substrate-binding protein